MWIVLAVTGCIVAVGLILLCSWKIFVTVHDRREYASFENEVKARRDEMVVFIFIPATMHRLFVGPNNGCIRVSVGQSAWRVPVPTQERNKPNPSIHFITSALA